MYQVTVKVLVKGPKEHVNAAGRFVHELAQEVLVGAVSDELSIVGASTSNCHWIRPKLSTEAMDLLMGLKFDIATGAKLRKMVEVACEKTDVTEITADMVRSAWDILQGKQP